ncbi:MAG: acyl-CoA dehydrogenase family protein [Myxococcota bacterium]|nr:acyl-CoA dehydrogenase family protein [Myxococcota bacterium]
MSSDSGFLQEPPRLANQYDDDALLRGFLRRRVDRDALGEIEPSLRQMGALAAGPLLELARAHRCAEPEHVPFDAWGRRVDEVRVNAAWQEYARVAAREGLIATGYERRHGRFSRLHQFALVYLFDRSCQVYTCPLAMTDGCARTLELLAEPALRDRVLPHLTARDPERAWTSGQWMTERVGGSDVGLSEAVARRDGEGWRLYGTKWFTSAVGSQVALTLARPEGNGPGGKGLALFFVELRDAAGRLAGIELLRLKEKLGTRNLPTAELRLDGTPARPVAGLSDGVRNMGTMLNLTRTWNAVSSAASLRRGLALARDYARRRVAFGAPLAEKPLHLETLADLAAEHAAAFLLAFHVVEQLGRYELGEAGERDDASLRLLHPLAKLATARQAVAGASETLEAFGGAGYVEDTGLPELLRDAQVLAIWEGTTNVLALECYRAIQRTDALRPVLEDARARARAAATPALREPAAAALAAADRVEGWWRDAVARGAVAHEAGARRFALALARTVSLSLLVEHADDALAHDADPGFTEAARRLAARGIASLDAPDPDPEATARLALGGA